MPISHAKPHLLAVKLGYPIGATGGCLGYAMLGMQAIFLNQLDKFVDRIDLMSDLIHERGIDGLADFINQIEGDRIIKLLI